jgi:uroporphyrinogen decarboxylase
MNSRERINAALNHQEPDRVAVDFGAHRSSGIAAMAYPRLRNALGLPERPTRIYDPIQQLAVIDDDVLDRFDVDAIELGRGFGLDDADWVDWPLPDGTPAQMPAWAVPTRDDEKHRWVFYSAKGNAIAVMPDGAFYFEQSYWPFAETDDLDAIEEGFEEILWAAIASPPGPLANGEGGDERLAEGARRLRERTDRAICGLFGGNLFELGQFFYRSDNFMMLLAADPDRADAFLRKLTAIHLRNLKKYLTLVGPYIDIIVFGDDLGTQKGPMMSPAMYRERFKPLHAKMWALAKELADVKVQLHCCGGVRPLLDDLIDAGLDAINPVQITCAGMDSGELKKDFGDRLTFWGGGCDTRDVLTEASPDEVRQHVKEQLDIWTPGGGFVFQQVHNILSNVPAENIIAMFDAVAEYK